MKQNFFHQRLRRLSSGLVLIAVLTGCAGNGPVSSKSQTYPSKANPGLNEGLNQHLCKTDIGIDNKSLTKSQRLARVHLGLGLGYLAEDVLDTAQKDLDKAIALDPQLARAYAGKALLDIRMKQADSAGVHYQKAIQLAPGDPEINNNYGLYLCSRGQYAQADKLFRCAIANPVYATPGRAYINAGRCALIAEKPDQALKDLGTAAMLMPKSRIAVLLMADAHYRLGQFDEAARNFARFSTGGNLPPSALWLGIKIYKEAQNLDKVASYSLLLRNKFPDSKEADLLRQQ